MPCFNPAPTFAQHAPIKVTVSTGPGQHHAHLVSSLVKNWADVLAIPSWPELSAMHHSFGADRFLDSAALPVDTSRGWRWASREESVGSALRRTPSRSCSRLPIVTSPHGYGTPAIGAALDLDRNMGYMKTCAEIRFWRTLFSFRGH